jgi:hypothetical protein
MIWRNCWDREAQKRTLLETGGEIILIDGADEDWFELAMDRTASGPGSLTIIPNTSPSQSIFCGVSLFLRGRKSLQSDIVWT